MLTLNAEIRNIFGKKTKKLRAEGKIPAELYGHNVENKHLILQEKDFLKVFKKAGESTIITLNINNEEIPALIVDVSINPLTQKILSVDLHQVKMDEKIEADIPINFIGDAKAIKKGLILVKVTSAVRVSSIPAKLPPNFEVDVSHLENIGDAIYVKDLKVDKAIKILTPPDTILVTITEQAKEETTSPTTPTEQVTTSSSIEQQPTS